MCEDISIRNLVPRRKVPVVLFSKVLISLKFLLKPPTSEALYLLSSYVYIAEAPPVC